MISVLIVSYEAREVLPRCLASVSDLVDRGHEVWVVDNASSDGSADLVRADFPSCHLLVMEENVGFGAANNRAAREARGDALLLLNPDAWLTGGCASELEGVLDRQEEVGLVAPTILYPEGRPQFNWAPRSGVVGEAIQTLRNRFESRSWAHRPFARTLRALGNRGWFSGSCCMIRRRAFEEIGGFDERYFLYFEDVDLCARLDAASWGLRECPAAVAHHERGALSGADTDKVLYRRSQFTYYRRNRPRWENRFLLSKQKRSFARESDPEYRRRLLEVWEEARLAHDTSSTAV